MKVKVIKRDSKIESYKEEKIVKVLKATGLEPQQALKIAQIVTAWIKIRKKPMVATHEIKDKVIEELKKINEYTANLFAWYEKSKPDHPSH